MKEAGPLPFRPDANLDLVPCWAGAICPSGVKATASDSRAINVLFTTPPTNAGGRPTGIGRLKKERQAPRAAKDPEPVIASSLSAVDRRHEKIADIWHDDIILTPCDGLQD